MEKLWWKYEITDIVIQKRVSEVGKSTNRAKKTDLF